MLIKSEEDLLQEGLRAKIIAEIQGAENKARKDEYYKRYQVYKDQTYNYVVRKMLKWFDQATIEEMSYAITNVSIGRKIIDKLARVYSGGVKREVMGADNKPDEKLTEELERLAKALCFNTEMKRINRAYKRDKNTLCYVKPYQTQEEGAEVYDLELCAMFPFLYDVVEDPNQREKPMCVILSHYSPPGTNAINPIQNSNQAGVHGSIINIKLPGQGDSKDQMIADTPSDQDATLNHFIWWSNNYHFTTNEKGQIVSSEDNANPIGVLPFRNFSEDQDGSYWALGGEDLVESSILINSLLSHMNHISVLQGYGQFYMTGKNLPRGIKIGPSKGIAIEHEKDDPTPTLGFLNANPPLTELKENIDMQVALLLTTNNLSVSGVATQLGNAQSPAAGISLIIDKAESMEDVSDQQQIFHDNEPAIWKIVAKWINLYKSRKLLAKRLQEFELPEDLEVQLKFPEPRPIMSEKEKLDNLVVRKDLGINTMEELLMLDDPNLTKDQAAEKIKLIEEEKAENLAAIMDAQVSITGQSKGTTSAQGDQGAGKPPANNGGAGAGPIGSAKGGPNGGKGGNRNVPRGTNP